MIYDNYTYYTFFYYIIIIIKLINKKTNCK